MSKTTSLPLRHVILGVGFCLLFLSLALGQVRDQPGGGGIPSPPAPGETVRDVPDGWKVVGTGSDDVEMLYRRYTAAYTRYMAAERDHGPDSGEARAARQDFLGKQEIYLRDGCGLVRIKSTQGQGGWDQGSTGSGGGWDTGSGGGSGSGPDPNDPMQTILITEGVRIQEKEFRLFESDVSRPILGDPADRDPVWVTVHGRVTDSAGFPVPWVTVHLTNSGKEARTNDNGEYSVSFRHDGFEPVEILLNPVLQSRCLVVTPKIVSFGTKALGMNPSEYVFVENTCPEEIIEVSYDSQNGPYHLEMVDCSTTGTMIMGPSTHCKLRLSFKPVSDGSWDEKLHITGSDVPGVPVKLRALATASGVVAVGNTEGHFQGTTSVGSSKDWTVTIRNQSPTSPLEVVVSDFDGAASGDFDAEIVAVTGVAPPPPPPPGQPPAPLVPHPRIITLPPGAQAMVAVTFEPRATGLREATLVFETSDPSVAVVKIPVSGIGD